MGPAFIIITITYTLLIILFIIAFDKVKPYEITSTTEKTTFSIIIPFRNEAENLDVLLNSISKLNYPKHLFEVILVNDASEDNSIEIIKKVLDTKSSKYDFTRTDISILNNKRTSNSPKKDAITTAIHNSKYDWIITTDADCILPKQWLKVFDAFIEQKQPKLIVAPISYYKVNSFFKMFQLLDILSLQSATVSGFGLRQPFLCNGANLAYKKEKFIALNGFDGNNNIASGDDIFFMEKMLNSFPKDIQYLKNYDAIVYTTPEPSFKSMFYQRVRWAAKTSSYNNWFGKLVGFTVFLMNAMLIIAFALVISGISDLIYLVSAFALKSILDAIFIYKSAKFHKQLFCLKYYVLSSFIYPFFSVFVVMYSLFFSYKWKGRQFSK